MACGGSDNAAAPDPVAEADRIAAATNTANNNAKCSTDPLGTYYWEVGDASGVKASGEPGSGASTATGPMWIYSASKWQQLA